MRYNELSDSEKNTINMLLIAYNVVFTEAGFKKAYTFMERLHREYKDMYYMDMTKYSFNTKENFSGCDLFTGILSRKSSTRYRSTNYFDRETDYDDFYR